MKTAMQTVLGVLAGAGVAAVAGVVVAGPLSPPAGGISPTYKTLTEVEPRVAVGASTTPGDDDSTPSLYKISEPGSYYLTGNVTGVAGKHGIEIASGGVTLDLCGFSVVGVDGSLTGVKATVSENNVVLRNGVVRGWGEHGVELVVLLGQRGMLVENVQSSENGGHGIRANTGVMRGCTATSNGSTGILVSINGSIESCTAAGNTIGGIYLGDAVVARGCTSISNGEVGFYVGVCGVLCDSVSRYNLGSGIMMSSGSTVRGCTSMGNHGHGIEVYQRGLAEGNMVTGNGLAVGEQAGIRVNGLHASVRGNTITDSEIGILVAGSGGAFVAGNTMADCDTAWTLSGTNSFGPLISASGQIASTNPWANFSR